MESLTGLDAAFLSFETPNAPLHVGAVIVFDPPPGKHLLFSESARFGFVHGSSSSESISCLLSGGALSGSRSA